MMTIRRSILLKLILAFWVMSVSGIVIIALLAGRISSREFNRFANEAQYKDLIDNLVKYYGDNGNFTGAGALLETASQKAQSGQAKEYLVIDQAGNILLSLVKRLPPGTPSPDLINLGFPITVGNKTVAYLIPMRPPKNMTEVAAENIHRINSSLLFGGIAVTVLALLFGWLMARNIIRPLRELNSATQSIAQGDLEKQVVISTRDEIGALAESFNAMTVSLKRSRDLRRQMTADIAHELRNPLSIILGHTEAMSEGVLPATPETLDIIYDEAKHLSRLVDDLRTISLSESGELSLQRSPVNPVAILERSASAYAVRAAEKGVTIRLEPVPDLPLINVDVERIGQVLANLLDNSLKHTPSGGSIRLSANSSDNMVRLSIQDDGSGIPPADLPYVFDRFYRGKQTSSRVKDGSGLGLAISKALVELHQGQISVTSELGQGTTITIALPVLKAA
ncbi:MAG: ATP-binding protein [Chloroflexi bacterium]|nr:ATP-binding protein [Chloroflexota bacterium]